jgi:hypothetical protein
MLCRRRHNIRSASYLRAIVDADGSPPPLFVRHCDAMTIKHA